MLQAAAWATSPPDDPLELRSGDDLDEPNGVTMIETCPTCGREVRPEKYPDCPRCHTPLDPESPEVQAAEQAAKEAEERRANEERARRSKVTLLRIGLGGSAVLGATVFITSSSLVAHGAGLLLFMVGVAGGSLAWMFR